MKPDFQSARKSIIEAQEILLRDSLTEVTQSEWEYRKVLEVTTLLNDAKKILENLSGKRSPADARSSEVEE